MHNRLTHSLEVASVGRSLGNIFYNELKKSEPAIDSEIPFIGEVGNIVCAACLAHDLGNPAFGHSGESAISRYFTDGDGRQYRSQVSDQQWHDLTTFEGNANALRMLTHPYTGKGNGAFALTYSTLAAIVKYPCASIVGGDTSKINQKKYGFFESEQSTFKTIASELGMKMESDAPMVYKRHPLVYLVEAADDICYNIIDLEDAHRLKILSYEKVKSLLMPICNDENLTPRLDEMEDLDAKVSFMRAKAINSLIWKCSNIFFSNQGSILEGSYNKSLTDDLPEELSIAWNAIHTISKEKIYNHSAVVQIEVAGYKVMGGLLEEFVPAMLNNDTHYYKKLEKLIPAQFKTKNENTYSKIQSVLDFVSGMTDLYAVELYRKIKGISFPSIQ